MVVLAGQVLAATWPVSDTWRASSDTWDAASQSWKRTKLKIQKIHSDGDHGDGKGDGAILALAEKANSRARLDYKLFGTLHKDEEVTVETSIFNPDDGRVEVLVTLEAIRTESTTDPATEKTTNKVTRTVLASEQQLLNGRGYSKSISLSTKVPETVVGQEIGVRYVTISGSHGKRFAVDSAKVDTSYGSGRNRVVGEWYFPGTSPFRRVPDLPAQTFDQGFQNEIETILKTYFERQLKTKVTASQLKGAIAAFDALEIKRNGELVEGSFGDWRPFRFLGVFAGKLYEKPDSKEEETVREDILNRVHLCLEGMARAQLIGEARHDSRGYDKRVFFRGALLLKDSLSQKGKEYLSYLMHTNYYHFDDLWDSEYPKNLIKRGLGSINTDDMYNMSDSVMIFCLGFQDTPEEAQRWAWGFKRYCERFCTPSPAQAEGIKIDGAGFHHWSDYPRYMYAYKTLTDNLNALRGSRLLIDEKAYRAFRDAVALQWARARDGFMPLSMVGRDPRSRGISQDADGFKKLAIVGGEILGKGSYDPELAAFYRAVHGTDDALEGAKIDSLSGAIATNYANTLAHRGEKWTAVVRGFTDQLWGTEIYPEGSLPNRYGRYQSYGSVEVIKSGGLAFNGISVDLDQRGEEKLGPFDHGWDWNHPNGGTTIVLPYQRLQAENERTDELQDESFAGGVVLSRPRSGILHRSRGQFGLFGMKFRQREGLGFNSSGKPRAKTTFHDDSFTFRKSSFTCGDLLVSLTSNISNDDQAHPTATTLFQRQFKASESLATSRSRLSGSGRLELKSGPRWIYDPRGVGFLSPAGNDRILVSVGDQTSPPPTLIDPSFKSQHQTGRFVKAYFDHGVAPSNKSCEFVIMPDAKSEKEVAAMSERMRGSADQRPYLVFANRSEHHIIRYQGGEKPVWGMALFEASAEFPKEGLVRRNDAPCLVMYEEVTPSSILLAVSDPDLKINNGEGRNVQDPALGSVVTLTLEGDWSISGDHSKVQAIVQRDRSQTNLTFSLKDGLAEEVQLNRRWPQAAEISLKGLTPYQTSTLRTGHARLVIDGETSGNWADKSISHTLNSAGQYWEVDLQGDHRITEVVLFNRTNPNGKGGSFGERLSNFKVEILDSAGEAVFSQKFYEKTGSVDQSEKIPVNSVIGRVIRISKLGLGRLNSHILSLAEVKVFGAKIPTNKIDLRGLEVYQKTTHRNARARLAIDGRINGDFGAGSVTHTKNSGGQFWKVKLNNDHQIEKIVLYNRIGSDVGRRLSNFRIKILNSSGGVEEQQDFYTDGGYAGNRFVYRTKKPGGVKGRVVRIEKLGIGHRKNYILSLAEVEIFGAPSAPSGQGDFTDAAINHFFRSEVVEAEQEVTPDIVLVTPTGDRASVQLGWKEIGVGRYTVWGSSDLENWEEVGSIQSDAFMDGSLSEVEQAMSVTLDLPGSLRGCPCLFFRVEHSQ